MAHVLHATAPADATRSSLRILSDRLSAIHLIPGYELVLRDQAWCEETLPTPQPFQDRLRDDYRAETVDVPFFKRPAEAAQPINAWFTSATNGQLNEIITPDQIVGDKVDFAVTSAVLFNGRWEDVFDAKETAKAPFHSGGKTFDVAMMSRPRIGQIRGTRRRPSAQTPLPERSAFRPLPASPGVARQLGKIGGVALCRDARSLSLQTHAKPGQCRDSTFRVRFRFSL